MPVFFLFSPHFTTFVTSREEETGFDVEANIGRLHRVQGSKSEINVWDCGQNAHLLFIAVQLLWRSRHFPAFIFVFLQDLDNSNRNL